MKTRGPDPRQNSYAPRGMRRDTAAWWVGISPTKFDELVADGRMPAGVLVDGCRVWDRYQLDDAFTTIMTASVAATAWGRVA
jgi:hypothetical protein